MRDKEQIKILLQKYLVEDLQEEELAILEAWADSHPAYRQLLEQWLSGEFLEDLRDFHADSGNDEDTIAYILAHAKTLHTRANPTPRRIWKWVPYAAAVIVAMVVGFFFLNDVSDTKPQDSVVVDIQPGGNRATLTLADGRAISLDETQSGIVIGDRITYLDGSTVLPREDRHGEDVTTLTLSTPRGGIYQLTLPDGSRVWLNANSTLKYPSRFDASERVVELEGEAYFEIRSAKYEVRNDESSKKLARELTPTSRESPVPFLVKSNGQTVEVLGTEFNISAYADDSEMKTTLVEGKVRLVESARGEHVSLIPGEQGQLANGVITKATVDTDQYTAWKSGRFHFNQTPFEEMIRQMARWYDIDVVYRRGIPNETFTGEMGRDLTLQAMLGLLDISDATISLEKRALIIQ